MAEASEAIATVNSRPRIDGAGIEAAWSVSGGAASSLATTARRARLAERVGWARTSCAIPVATRSRARPVTAPTTEATRKK